MSNVDLSKLITAQDKAAGEAMARVNAIKAEVQTRIFAVVNQNTQASLLAAMVAGGLTKKQQTTFGKGQAWIEATKVAGRNAILSGDDPVWPEVPEGVQDLADTF